MAACAAQTFGNVSGNAWTCLKQKVQQQLGITITTNSGQQTQQGFTVAWNYDPGAQTLTLQCTDSPWWAPCSMINGKIHDLVENSGCLSS